MSRAVAGEDEGSVLLLALGYALLAVALILVCVCATDLYISQKRLDALADSAALAGAEDFELVVEDGAPVARLDDEEVRDRAAEVIAEMPVRAVLLTAETPDGVSARVEVEAPWHPPVFSFFVPEGIVLHATGTGRTALG